MRIISKQKDYYDSCMIHGMDLNLVYVRDTEETHIENKNIGSNSDKTKFDKFHNGVFFNRRVLECAHPLKEARQGEIAFCGKIYPYVSCDTDFFYTFDDFKKHFDYLGDHKYKKTYPKYLSYVKRYFEKNSVWEDESLFIEYHTPIFTVEKYEYWSSEVDRIVYPTIFIKNPILKKYQFYKVLDAFSTFQEIQMFLGNQLCDTTEAEMPVGGDIIVAQSKGYDKWSFRKEPTKRK